MKNYKFKVPIGDWSGDGHDKCIYYTVLSNYPVEDVREFYFESVEKSGINFCEEFCSDYLEFKISEEKLHLIPFDIKKYSKDGYFDTDDFVIFFLDWIKYYNPEFEYEIIDDDIPMLPFYGFDSKHRHIGHIGYGLFE